MFNFTVHDFTDKNMGLVAFLNDDSAIEDGQFNISFLPDNGRGLTIVAGIATPDTVKAVMVDVYK